MRDYALALGIVIIGVLERWMIAEVYRLRHRVRELEFRTRHLNKEGDRP